MFSTFINYLLRECLPQFYNHNKNDNDMNDNNNINNNENEHENETDMNNNDIDINYNDKNNMYNMMKLGNKLRKRVNELNKLYTPVNMQYNYFLDREVKLYNARNDSNMNINNYNEEQKRIIKYLDSISYGYYNDTKILYDYYYYYMQYANSSNDNNISNNYLSSIKYNKFLHKVRVNNILSDLIKLLDYIKYGSNSNSYLLDFINDKCSFMNKYYKTIIVEQMIKNLDALDKTYIESYRKSIKLNHSEDLHYNKSLMDGFIYDEVYDRMTDKNISNETNLEDEGTNTSNETNLEDEETNTSNETNLENKETNGPNISVLYNEKLFLDSNDDIDEDFILIN